jgi:hypothetical protein
MLCSRAVPGAVLGVAGPTWHMLHMRGLASGTQHQVEAEASAENCQSAGSRHRHQPAGRLSSHLALAHGRVAVACLLWHSICRQCRLQAQEAFV